MTRYAYDSKTFRLMRLRTEAYTATTANGTVTYEYQSGTTKQDLAYAYDLAGNITGITDRTPGCGIANSPNGEDKLVRNFTYDALYRLLSATGRETLQTDTLTGLWDDSVRPEDTSQAQPYTQSYQYDLLGNILSLVHSATGGFTRSFIYQAQSNKLENLNLGHREIYEYRYDANGNQTQESETRKFEWDYADRLRVFYNKAENVGVVDGIEPSVYANYCYDAGGQRVKKITRKQGGSNGIYEVTVYIDGLFEHRYKFSNGSVNEEQTLLHIMDDQKRIATKVSGDLMGQFEEVQYFLDDHLGSSSVVLNANGSLINREEYYPFGETSFGAFAKKRYRFCGKERDEESGLYYYGARYYAPWICRFISGDPRAIERNWVSFYNYVQNNVINKADPTGELDDWVQGKNGDIKWDNAANSQATTKYGETYLGKTLTFEFNSYINKNLWDVPTYKTLWFDVSGDKLTSTVSITGHENNKGELISITSTSPKVKVGPTPIGTGRDFYPGLGSDQNKCNTTISASNFKLNFEQHSSVSVFEEFSLNMTGFRIVNVAQKLDLNYSDGKLSVSAATDVFPSATLTMNNRIIMEYDQPSFKATHSAPIKGWTKPNPYKEHLGPSPIYDFFVQTRKMV